VVLIGPLVEGLFFCIDVNRNLPPRVRRTYQSRYPGLKFRVVDEQGHMRAHMRFFVNNEQVFDLSHALRPTDKVYLLQALNGG